MSVYFARSEIGIKIGFSENPEKRMRALLSRVRRDIVLLLVLDGDMDVERKFHKRFSSLRIRDEWFKEKGQLAEFLCQNSCAPTLFEYKGKISKKNNGNTHVYISMAEKKALEIIAEREARSVTRQIAVFIRQGLASAT